MASRLALRFGKDTPRVLFNLQSLASFHRSCPALYAAPIQIKMPALSPTMTEGTIIKWHKKEGDKISPGDMLVEVQTDKAVIPFELEEEGTMAKIIAPVDKPIQIGTVIGIMVMPGDDWKNVTVPDSGASQQQSQPASAATSSTATQAAHHHDSNQKIGPAARHLVTLYNVDLSKIKATGPHGFITKNDVKEYISQNNLKPVTIEASSPVVESSPPPAAPAPKAKPSTPASSHTADFEDLELSNIRKVIAKRLLFSKTTIPHSYITTNCVADKIINLRKEMIKRNEKVSVNDFLIKAIGLALRMVPELNSNLNEKTNEYTQLSSVDISVAVATDKGLITPIVKNADKLSVLNISQRVKELADKARQGKLLPHEFQGGSFSISNLGMFGVKEFSAVINPPQVGILAVGTSQLKFNEEMKVQTEMSFTLSYDERCVSLDRAMHFLTTLNYFIANPDLLVDKTQQY